MSRVGRRPIPIPKSVTVTIDGQRVTVKGPKGELHQEIHPRLTVRQEDGQLIVDRGDTNDRVVRSQHGLARTLIANMVQGVTEGHSKTLEVQGVGFRVQPQGQGLVLSMGYSHPVTIDPIPGISFEVTSDEKKRVSQIKVSGIDKALVGQVAADIRKVRKPDPYKGKGIRYLGEVVKLKAGKRASAKK